MLFEDDIFSPADAAPTINSMAARFDMLLKCLKDPIELNKLRKQLNKEFCAENLLFFEECCAYKQLLEEISGLRLNKERFSGVFENRAIKHLENKELQNLIIHQYSQNLYDEFISSDSQYYVNIPGTLNQAIQRELSKDTNLMDALYLLDLIDQAQKEVFMLMMESFDRSECS